MTELEFLINKRRLLEQEPDTPLKEKCRKCLDSYIRAFRAVDERCRVVRSSDSLKSCSMEIKTADLPRWKPNAIIGKRPDDDEPLEF